jgi:Tfp pilus assembly protein PilV
MFEQPPCPRRHDIRSSVRRRTRASRGYTLVELALAMTMLMVALMSISAATLRTHSLRRHSRERTLANTVLRTTAERIHSLSYRTVESNPAGWAQDVLAAYGPGGSIGNTFDVIGLNPVTAGGQVGRIEILTDETASDAALGVELGLPRDLNGDLDASDTDVSGDARILPVVLSVNYSGASGPVTIEHTFYIVGF